MKIIKINKIKFMNHFVLFLLLFIYCSTEEPVYNSYYDCFNSYYIDKGTEASQYFSNLKFYFDKIYISEQLHEANHDAYATPLFKAIDEAGRILESILEMYVGWNPGEIISTDENEIKDYVEKWNRDLLRYNISDEDIFLSKGYTIMIIFRLGEEMDDKIVANSRILLEDFFYNPEVGLVTLNPNIDYTMMSLEYLTIIMIQQFTQLLAFKETILSNSLCFNYLEERDNEHFLLSSPKVVEYAIQYFGDNSLTYVEMVLDDDNFYWSPRYFLGEYMSDITYSEELVISGFTLALFEDLGYLKVKNKYTGGLMRFGKNQGKDFFSNQCNEKQFKNDFYYPTDDQITLDFTEPSCSSGRLSKTIHKLIYDENIPEDYQYYKTNNPNLGGLKSVEYCPVSMYSSDIIFSGSCSQVKNTPNTNIGESFSSHSFCALSSLVSTDINNYNTLSQSVRAVCFEMYCSEKSLSIKYGDYYFVCPKEGGKIKADEIGFVGYLLCPDYNLICTGTTLCNNLFDCIKEQSSENERSFNYEGLDIKTTQISSDYNDNEYPISNGCEESEDGKCPLNCAVCKKKNENNYKCIKCGDGFGLKGFTNSDNTECVISSNLEIGYYQSPNLVYYPCIPNCKICNNGNSCETCLQFYVKNQDNICEEKVPNCQTYDANEECTECKSNYDLVKAKNGDFSCKKTSELQEQYYSEVQGGKTYYIKCSDDIENCYSCSSSTFCHSCMDGYGIIDQNNHECKEITNEYYYDTELNSYKLCSNKNTGCKKCTKIDNNDINCIECDTSYSLIYSEINKCILQTSIRDDKSIFFNSKTLKYYKCNDNRYHSVKNCLTCHSEDKCDTCQNGYEISNSNELCVSNVEINEKKYYKDSNDNNYYLCSKLINGCDTCENAEKCLQCNIGYNLDENDKCIPTALALTKYYFNTETGRYVSCSKIENCEECSSGEICTKCNSGYEINNNSCQIIEQKKDDKYKAIAIAGLVLGCIGIVGTIISILLIFFKKLLLKKFRSKGNDTTDSASLKIEKNEENNNNNDNNNDNNNYNNNPTIHSRRNLSNTKKDS